jgi:hypothetical protein
MKHKTSELIESSLDTAVAMAVRKKYKVLSEMPLCLPAHLFDDHVSISWRPSTRPEQGMPIMELEHIETRWLYGEWEACKASDEGFVKLIAQYHCEDGPTMLVAGMRCFVALYFGHEVDLP